MHTPWGSGSDTHAMGNQVGMHMPWGSGSDAHAMGIRSGYTRHGDQVVIHKAWLCYRPVING